jgi:DNA-binding MarR family transcriptional regulator
MEDFMPSHSRPANRSAVRTRGKSEAAGRNKRPNDRGSSQALLQHWREAVPNDRLAHLVKDASRSLARALQMRLAEHGVSYGHWPFMRVLWEHDGLTQRDLSAEAGVMEPTTFTAMKAMERLGYVERRQAPDNKKNLYIFLTPKGRALKRRLVPLAEEVNRVAVRGLKASDVSGIRRSLLFIIENLVEDEVASARMQRRVPSTRAISRLAMGEK